MVEVGVVTEAAVVLFGQGGGFLVGGVWGRV